MPAATEPAATVGRTSATPCGVAAAGGAETAGAGFAAAGFGPAARGVAGCAAGFGAAGARAALAFGSLRGRFAALLAGESMLLGLGTGAGFAVAAVAFRAASLSLRHPSFAVAAAVTLAVTTLIQSLLMTGWLSAREPGQVSRVVRSWRRSLLPGVTGAAASACWFTAMTIEPAAHVRMLGLVEVVFGFGVAIFAHRQPPSRRELAGTALLVLAIAALLWERA